MSICSECNDDCEDDNFEDSGMCQECFECCCPVCRAFVSDNDFDGKGMCTACYVDSIS